MSDQGSNIQNEDCGDGDQNLSEAEILIKKLGLVSHPEGGRFLETFRSGCEPMLTKGQTDENGSLVMTEKVPTFSSNVPRNVMTSIYWLMIQQSNPVLHWIVNKSDHVHYWHGGGSILFHIITPDGEHRTERLGGNINDLVSKNAKPQVVVEGGNWKAAELDGEYCLIGEAVAPGFDFNDFVWGNYEDLCKLVGDERAIELQYLLHKNPDRNFDDFYSEK